MSKFYFCKLSIFIILLTFSVRSYSQELFSSQYNLESSAEFGFGTYYTGARDFIEISYGVGNLKHKNISTNFSSLSQSEIKLGRRFLKPMAGYKIIHFSDNYLFSSFVSYYESGNSSGPLDITFDIWRFGLGYRKGYGYNFSSFAIMPYHQLGLLWNRFQILHPFKNIRVFEGNNYDNEIKTINLYDEEIKFGTNNIGGIEFRLGSLIAIGASYETSVIFPYHKFWKQIGSFFIETFAQTGIDFLTEGVLIEKVPALTPILYFLLKNGLSYYTYTLKQDEMNWPFDTVAPLTLESIKFSAKISF